VAEIKKIQPEAEIAFVTDKRFFDFAKEKLAPLDVPVSKVSAGKFRRYANLKWYQQFEHIFISYIPNFFDMFRFGLGIVQAKWKMRRFKPDVVFVKGGYVGLPVGLAAHWFKVPLVLHDSDAVPGLTNRILAKYAVCVGLGMPQESWHYDKSKTEFVGIPIDPRYKLVGAGKKKQLRKKLVEESTRPIILAMGGSQGSRTINEQILKNYPKIKGRAEVFLITGSDNYNVVKNTTDNSKRQYLGLRILPFISGDDLYDLVDASDIAVTRAGATSIAELAAGQKATVIIPSPYLSSDHQSKNAELLQLAKAAVVIPEDRLNERFPVAIENLLADPKRRQDLGKKLHKFASTDAATKMAEIILKVVDDAQK